MSTAFVTPPLLDSKTEHYISTILALLLIVLAFLVSVKKRRGPKMRPHRVQHSQITTPTGSIRNAYNGYLRIPGPQRWSRIILVICCSCHLTIEKTIKMKQDGLFFVIKKFPIGLKENLKEDNLSTRDNWPIPNVSFVQRFYCKE